MNIPNIKVKNMQSPRTGAPVANQYIITDHDTEIFQSYETIIAVRYWEAGYIHTVLDRKMWDYSRTTKKYLSVFLYKSIACIREDIKLGNIELDDLN